MKVRLLATVAVLMLSSVVGCHFASRNPPSTKTLQVPMTKVLTQSEINQSITLDVGNTLVVELGSNYTTPLPVDARHQDRRLGDHQAAQSRVRAAGLRCLGGAGHRDVDVRGHEAGDHHHRRDVQQLCGEGRQAGVRLYADRDRAISPCGVSGYATATWRCRA